MDAMLEWYAANTASQTITFNYFLSYYWAMETLISGSTIMEPTNIRELLIIIGFVFGGLLVCSCIISWLSAELIERELRFKEKNEKMIAFRRYLCQNDVDPMIAAGFENIINKQLSK